MEQTQTELLAEEKTSGNEFLRVEHLKKYFVIVCKKLNSIDY